ncbi:related to Alcohol dehydrogenase 1 [Phialocephala subalpina]|uniref:Related to Alcohol dehydrogenase 1 n=1 Tax=Phialocephala subalpina TaxID=576137 RepID=A0A1L7XST8_9HELO|nr:related to Alcohol dehydrogenase 1 [Phialocephala subalpina]
MASDAIPAVQTAAVLKGAYGELHTIVEDWPVPKPGPDEALIRIEASGVCSGDINPRDGYPPAPNIPNRPLVSGHEGVGYIVALGEDTGRSFEFAIGDRVGMGWRRSTCHQCSSCQTSKDNLCQKVKMNGYDGHGTNQEYVAVPVSNLISIPKSTAKATELAPLLCAGGTALGGVRSANLKPGEWLCVVGAAGGVGGLAVQYGKHFGYHVVAIDSNKKEKHCMKMGADVFVDYEDTETVVHRIREATNGGSHGTVVCSASPTSYSQAIEYSAVGATIVSVGPAMVQFHTGHLMVKGLKLVAQTNGSKTDIEDALALSNVGIVSPVEVILLANVDKALDALKLGKAVGRQVICPL